MQFQFYPLRFEFVARDSLYFPPGKAANILRGALGIIFKRQDPQAYSRVFEPASGAAGPSGLTDRPRPFVFRARHLDGSTIQPSQSFHFDLHVFSIDPLVITAFVDTFAALAREGLGPGRGKAELQRVRRLAAGDLPELELSTSGFVEPIALDLASLIAAPNKIRVEFLSPTELKHGQGIASRPEFPILFSRIRDRIGTLSELYGPGPLAIDFRAMGTRAVGVRTTNCEVRRQEFKRRSSRTGQTHSIGGFVGFAEYEGEMAEFLPYLAAAHWTGVGRQAVWGKGEISLELLF